MTGIHAFPRTLSKLDDDPMQRALRAEEAKKAIPVETESTITRTLVEMKNNRISDFTVSRTKYQLKYLKRKTDIFNPEEVKAFISTMLKENKQPVKNSVKNKYLTAYDHFCQNQNIPFDKPFYKIPDQIPLIPTARANMST